MKIAIAGYGQEGRSSYRYWSADPKNELTVFDENKLEQMEPDGVFAIIGTDAFSQLNGYDLVIRTAGLAPSKIVTDGKIWSATNEFFAKCPAQIIGVTGTKGKGTTASLMASIFEAAGKKVWLLGNIGTPSLDSLRNIKSDDIVIYELSSFQLELIDQLSCKQMFDVACILNITHDHLDRYPDFAAYCSAKLNIFKQAKNIVYYIEDHNINVNVLNNLPNIKTINTFGSKIQKKLLPINELSLKEEHNILNALACLTIGDLLDFPMNIMINILKNFSGLDHRCQKIETSDGLLWINDSKGTNIGATIAAVTTTIKHSYSKLIIILGGINKNTDLSMLKPYVVEHCKTAILIGTCKNQLFNILNKSLDCRIATDLKMAVSLAKQIANKGDTILFSPACASFDMFENYKHRGEVFKKCVLELNNETSA